MGQQEVVEAFGNKASPVRLLLTSVVASEGINFHFRTLYRAPSPPPRYRLGKSLKT
jgi:hypothetical protein